MDMLEMFEYERTKIKSEFPDHVHENTKVAVPYLILLCLATLIGSVGNTFVIGAVLVDKSLRTNGNVFVVNLAIADICVTSFVNPFNILGIVEGEGWFQHRGYLCEAVGAICLASCFCSLHSIGAISFNRFIHICHYDLYNRIFTFKASVVMAMVLWVECFLMTMPNFIGWGDFVYDRKNLGCVWDRTADFSYTLFFALAGVVFPVSLIAICYVKIFLHVRQSKRKIAAMNKQQSQMSSTERRHSMRLSRTLFVIFVIFTACWTPYAIIVTADINDTWPLELHIFSILLAHTNSSLNCILYGLTNREFRRGYLRFIKATKCGAYMVNKLATMCRAGKRLPMTTKTGTCDSDAPTHSNIHCKEKHIHIISNGTVSTNANLSLTTTIHLKKQISQ